MKNIKKLFTEFAFVQELIRAERECRECKCAKLFGEKVSLSWIHSLPTFVCWQNEKKCNIYATNGRVLYAYAYVYLYICDQCIVMSTHFLYVALIFLFSFPFFPIALHDLRTIRCFWSVFFRFCCFFGLLSMHKHTLNHKAGQFSNFCCCSYCHGC